MGHLAETLPAGHIEGMRAQLAQQDAKGNPPNELFELHCRRRRDRHQRASSPSGSDGTRVVRKEASFPVLNANPLDDITNTRRIFTVYLRGKEVDRPALKARFMAASGQKR